jgi:tetratricopeptide (TPR) repeat protein
MQGQSPFVMPNTPENIRAGRKPDRELARVSLRRALRAAHRATAKGACFLLVSSCSAVPRQVAGPSAASASTTGERATVSVPRTIVTKDSAIGVDELAARARVSFAERRFDEAARDFDRILELDPEGSFSGEAWFFSAAAHDELGDLDGASTRYLEMARRHPNDSRTGEALVRSVRLLTYLERWEAAGNVADVLLVRAQELTPLHQIVAYGGKSLSLVFSGKMDSAEYFLNKGRDVVDAQRLDAAGALPRDLAGLYFALGELRRIRGEKIEFVPVPPNFPAVLEARCQLLLDAQSAYSDAMRAYDAHWSAMAGFRVGELYQKLHEDLMRIPPPTAATTRERADLFSGAMRLRYAVLLRKGLAMMEHTLSLAERTGERSEWVARANLSKGALEKGIRDEEAALDRLPYSRADLERALEEVGKRNTGPKR